MPPHQHSAETTPALRGPACSSQPPHNAADTPSMKMNSVKVTLTAGTVQLHCVENSSAISDCCVHSAAAFPTSLVIGSQNTENP